MKSEFTIQKSQILEPELCQAEITDLGIVNAIQYDVEPEWRMLKTWRHKHWSWKHCQNSGISRHIPNSLIKNAVYNDNHHNVFIFPIFLNVWNECQHLSRSFKEYKQSSHFVLRLERLQVSVNNRGRSPVQEVDPLTHLTSAQERLELCIILYNMRKYCQDGTHLSQCQQWHKKIFAQVIHTWSQWMHWHCWYCCCCCCSVLFIQYQCQRPPKLSNIAGAELAHGKYLQLCIAPFSWPWVLLLEDANSHLMLHAQGHPWWRLPGEPSWTVQPKSVESLPVDQQNIGGFLQNHAISKRLRSQTSIRLVSQTLNGPLVLPKFSRPIQFVYC